MSKKTLEDRLADIADEAEAGEEDQTVKPIPAHVKVTRGNPRSRVLQVRLNPDEYAAIERIAERRGLPASTVAREALLKLVAEEDAEDQPLVTLVALADRIKAVAVDVACASYYPRDHTMIADIKSRADIPNDPDRLWEYLLNDPDRWEYIFKDPDRLRKLREYISSSPDRFREYGELVSSRFDRLREMRDQLSSKRR